MDTVSTPDFLLIFNWRFKRTGCHLQFWWPSEFESTKSGVFFFFFFLVQWLISSLCLEPKDYADMSLIRQERFFLLFPDFFPNQAY